MSELISYHLEDGIATLTLSNGKVNAISPDVIAAFAAMVAPCWRAGGPPAAGYDPPATDPARGH